jgi:hypothetical protein
MAGRLKRLDSAWHDREPGKKTRDAARPSSPTSTSFRSARTIARQSASSMFVVALSEVLALDRDTDALAISRDVDAVFEWAQRFGDTATANGFLEYDRASSRG